MAESALKEVKYIIKEIIEKYIKIITIVIFWKIYIIFHNYFQHDFTYKICKQFIIDDIKYVPNITKKNSWIDLDYIIYDCILYVFEIEI